MIVDQDFTPLLSRKAAEQMGIITVNYGNFNSVFAIEASVPWTG